jgi:hypothetical protein
MTKPTPFLIVVGGKARCSSCKEPFPAYSELTASKMFAQHLKTVHPNECEPPRAQNDHQSKVNE